MPVSTAKEKVLLLTWVGIVLIVDLLLAAMIEDIFLYQSLLLPCHWCIFFFFLQHRRQLGHIKKRQQNSRKTLLPKKREDQKEESKLQSKVS